MSNGFETMQKYSKDQLEQVSNSAAAMARGFQAIASETTDYSKRSLEQTSAFVEKIVGARSIDTAIQLQTDYAKSSFEGFMSQATKVGEIFKDMAKEAFRPVEGAVSRTNQAFQQQ